VRTGKLCSTEVHGRTAVLEQERPDGGWTESEDCFRFDGQSLVVCNAMERASGHLVAFWASENRWRCPTSLAPHRAHGRRARHRHLAGVVAAPKMGSMFGGNGFQMATITSHGPDGDDRSISRTQWKGRQHL
jgi:hypothetical protein